MQTADSATPLGPVAAERLAGWSPRRRLLFERACAARRRSGGSDSVQLLRPGSGDPIVLVHPVGGQVFAYADLVRMLSSGRPVYGLVAAEPSGIDAPAGLAEMAFDHVDRMVAAGIRPAVIAGWSFGGVLGYEIARQHASRYAPVPVLLLDSVPTPARYVGRDRPVADRGQAFVEDLLLSSGHEPPALPLSSHVWTQPPPVALAAVLDELARQGVRLPLTAPEAVVRFGVFETNLAALDHYVPTPYDGPVHLVRAERWPEDLSTVWRALVPEDRLTVDSVPTDHHGLLRPPVVAQVARILDGLTAGAA